MLRPSNGSGWDLRVKAPRQMNETLKVLENEAIRAAFDPACGRLRLIQTPRGSNHLWQPSTLESEAPDWARASQRTFLLPQAFWAQLSAVPQEAPEIDGASWKVIEATSETLRMVSPITRHTGARVSVSLRLRGGEPALAFSYRVERLREARHPIHLWFIARVPLNGRFLIDSPGLVDRPCTRPCINLLRSANFSGVFDELDDAILLRESLPNSALKVGTFGRWIARIAEGEAFALITPEPQIGEPYLEESNLQFFSFPGRFSFAELEWTSPLHALRPGESFEAHAILAVLPVGEDSSNWPARITEAAEAFRSEA